MLFCTNKPNPPAERDPGVTQTNPRSLPIGSVSQNRARPLRTYTQIAHEPQRRPRVSHEKHHQFSSPEVGRTPGPRGTPSFRLREYPAMPRAGWAAHNRGVILGATQRISQSALFRKTPHAEPATPRQIHKQTHQASQLALFRKTAQGRSARTPKSRMGRNAGRE